MKTLDEHVRQQVKEEIGDDENFPQVQKFALLQKYGIAKPVIDKNISQPAWIGTKEWLRLEGTWRAMINRYRNSR